MPKAGKHGVSATTPEKILFGAGTIHKNLTYSNGAWNLDTSIVGATSGGSKIEIVPEITKIEVDGAWVKVKQLSDKKTGETAKFEINFIEITPEILKASIVAEDGTSEDSNFTVIQSKPDIEEGDYWDNVAFVGKTLAGDNVIVIMENALCVSGFSTEGKSKEASVGTYTFESYAELTSDLDTLPWKIYYPA